MKIARTIEELRQLRGTAASPVGLVPTMGALHAGHVALMETARRESACVVASIFINPLQFGDPADLAAYPRDEARDAESADKAGVDLLFIPTVETMYPAGHATWVDVEGAAEGFEGAFRPGHFRGVATVCTKLFCIVQPDVAYFGQKDAQQVAVIQQVVHDLNLNLTLRVVPTVRDADGLALSSRNARLSTEERSRALAIPRALEAGLAAFREGRDPVVAARAILGNLDVEYVDVALFRGQPTLAIATRVGRTRLIDNVILE